MTNLNPVVGMNKYCGPAVLAVLTGKSTDECAYAISRITGKSRVEAVYLNDLLMAADKLGFDQIAYDKSSTLYGTLVRLVNDDGMYIVTVEKHFVCIEVQDKKIFFCDNHTKEPMPAASSARMMQRVIDVHKVVKRPETVIEPPKPEPEPKLPSRAERIIMLNGQINYINSQIGALMEKRREYENELQALKKEY